ncbi:hypothetical protein [Helicobacter bilis]|uniref:hypothetical protein n=1 Tax=Helicobacter bilis TaxID=37372 RepID=UPI0026ED0330|nr:hypothetical protein [Helicobacter bilis]MCI7410415.1 hypothetical protein [Helicobacter bilis]MDY4399780.1 hypothetical protein [Helicobacter bilis]
MRYTGLTKLGKKAFCVNFTLLDKLKITTKEAILLQQIEFVNKKSDFLVLPLTILSTITNMSRGHLYRCLNKLKKIGLIVVTDEGIAITDYYKEIREQDFLENHSKYKALKQKMAKKSQNVACFQGYRVADLEQEVMSGFAQHDNKGSNHSKIAVHDEFYYTQYRCDDIETIQNANDVRCLAYAQHDNNWQYDKQGQQDKEVLHSQNITEKSNKAKNAKSVACDENAKQDMQGFLHENNKTTNTQENKALNSQNSHSFFVTNLSQNVTNLSQNETPIYNKEYNNISLCDTSHKEYIYSLPKEAANKKQGLRDSLAFY